MFRRISSQLWNDQSGAIVSTEVVLVATILVIGAVVGLEELRDAVISELNDMAQAVTSLDQSYSYSPVSGAGAFTAGSSFSDVPDDSVGNAPFPDQSDSIQGIVTAAGM